MSRTIIIFLLGLLSVACIKRIPVPEAQPAHIVDPHAAWSRVLSENVDDKGRVDFQAIAADKEDLETWVAYVAVTDPEEKKDDFPEDSHKLAYYLDAYNGLAMYAAVVSGRVPKQTIRFFFLQKVKVANKEMTLYELENKVVRPMGESRIHFALNCMSVGCPRLPQKTWDGDNLEEQLQGAAVEFFNDEKHLQIDDSRLVVRISEILKFYTEDFLADAPSLIEYANKYRDKKIPKGYRVEFIPYDWTLNQTPAAGSETEKDEKETAKSE